MAVETLPFIPVTLNGEPQSFASGSTLADIVSSLNLAEDRLAIELNREIVKRGCWPTTLLTSGAEIELVQFVGGG